jgi:hypothetical protein
VRVRAEADRVDLVLALPIDPGVDEVLGEDVALEQEVVVGLERVEHLGERTRDLLDLGVLLGRQLVEVLVHGLRGLDAVLDAVQAGHELGREGEVGVARRVRDPELDALGLRGGARDRDADAGRAVAGRVDQVDRSLVARDETVVGVDRRVGEGQQRRGVLEQATDVPAGEVRQAAVAALVVEQRLAVLPQDWWVCMPEPLSPKIGFGMKVTVLPNWRQAVFLMTYLNFIMSSPLCSRVLKR